MNGAINLLLALNMCDTTCGDCFHASATTHDWLDNGRYLWRVVEVLVGGLGMAYVERQVCTLLLCQNNTRTIFITYVLRGRTSDSGVSFARLNHQVVRCTSFLLRST